MKPSGIILSECHDAPVTDVKDERGYCSVCGKENWAYDTGLAESKEDDERERFMQNENDLHDREMESRFEAEREEIIEADKDLLTDEQINNSIGELP